MSKRLSFQKRGGFMTFKLGSQPNLGIIGEYGPGQTSLPEYLGIFIENFRSTHQDKWITIANLSDIVINCIYEDAQSRVDVHANTKVLNIATTAVDDADIGNNQYNLWLDESNNVLTFRIRKSDGTLITKTI